MPTVPTITPPVPSGGADAAPPTVDVPSAGAALATAAPLAERRTGRADHFWRVAASAGAALLLSLLTVFAVGEWQGWPWLAGPLQQQLSQKLGRPVQLVDGLPAQPVDGAAIPPFALHLLGGIDLVARQVRIAAPAWSREPHLLQADGLHLQLRYVDLWRAWRGQPLRIDALGASRLDARLERLADGRASWALAPTPAAGLPPGAAPPPLPSVGRLSVEQGVWTYRDAPLAVDLQGRLSLLPPSDESATPQLQLDATGRYRNLPATLSLTSRGARPMTTVGEVTDKVGGPAVPAVPANAAIATSTAIPAIPATPAIPPTPAPARLPVLLKAEVGRAALRFQGTLLAGAWPGAWPGAGLGGLAGQFMLSGPSLSAVGDPVRVTLPTTGPFRADGWLVRQGTDWKVRLDQMHIGASRLNGAFVYATGGALPMLSGRLGGARLGLADLGPAVGAGPQQPVAPGKVLPVRPFDLAALRAMDANVLIDIAEVDLNTSRLEPLRPLRGHLQLAAGVLSIRQLEARTAQGRVHGDLALDGRADSALWRADLGWDGVQLEQWIHQTGRPAGAPPYVSGRLHGRAALTGQGRSTAEILGSLKGNASAVLTGGAVSHLVIEGAGLDVAQALGVLVKGDDALPVSCGAADLVADKGLFRPRVMVLDTTDSTVMLDGTVSLATEAMDLRAVVSPKDISPLTLRTPLRVRGTFASPKLSVDPAPLGRKLGASLLLGLINPLAALLPLIDLGGGDSLRPAAAQCEALMQQRAAGNSAGLAAARSRGAAPQPPPRRP